MCCACVTIVGNTEDNMDNVNEIAEYIHANTDTGIASEATTEPGVAVAVLLLTAHGISLYGPGPMAIGSTVITEANRYGVRVTVHDATPELQAWMRESGAKTDSRGGSSWLKLTIRQGVTVVAFVGGES